MMTRDALNLLFQHVATTGGVTVRVSVNFMPEQSRVDSGRWFWVYHIRLENHREDVVRLRTRHWRISDSRGMINVVDGEGVVGETPVLAPGESYDYVSGCELTTSEGAMQGHYSFTAEDGSSFLVAIPHFPLVLPDPVE